MEEFRRLVMLPDGREVYVSNQGRFGYPQFYWYSSGRELTNNERNERIDGIHLDKWIITREEEHKS